MLKWQRNSKKKHTHRRRVSFKLKISLCWLIDCIKSANWELIKWRDCTTFDKRPLFPTWIHGKSGFGLVKLWHDFSTLVGAKESELIKMIKKYKKWLKVIFSHKIWSLGKWWFLKRTIEARHVIRGWGEGDLWDKSSFRRKIL